MDKISAQEVANRLGTDREPFILDVREPNEVTAWSIPGSLNIPLRELSARTGELPDDKEVVVVCSSGGRSAYATRLLTRAGYLATNLTGGLDNWPSPAR